MGHTHGMMVVAAVNVLMLHGFEVRMAHLDGQLQRGFPYWTIVTRTFGGLGRLGGRFGRNLATDTTVQHPLGGGPGGFLRRRGRWGRK